MCSYSGPKTSFRCVFQIFNWWYTGVRSMADIETLANEHFINKWKAIGPLHTISGHFIVFSKYALNNSDVY